MAPPLPESRKAALRAAFEDQIPFHKEIGFGVESLDRGSCTARVPARPAHVGDTVRPALHGGLVSAAIDAAAGLAAFTAVAPSDTLSTLDLRVDFLRPGRTDTDLLLSARLLRAGTRVAVAEVWAHHGDPEQAVARGTVTFSLVRRS
jgi:uncharacterized protein (TIGR00369 family)